MGETDDLLGILREVDQAVVARPELAGPVSAVLPPYRDGAAAGWFERFAAWASLRSSRAATFPDPEAALDRMAAAQLDRSRLQARRRLVLDALAAAVPDRFGPEGAERPEVEAALPPPRPTGIGPSTLRTRILLVRVEPGDPDPIPLLTTELPAWGHAVGRVERLLDPGTWPELSGELWADMIPLDDPGVAVTAHPGLSDDQPRCYREVFHISDHLRLTPVLQFVRTTLDEDPPARALEYRICPHAGRPGHEADPLVKVDAGSIVVREVDGWLQVTTTKRVGFTGPFNGPDLAMLAHVLGYQEAFEEMVDAVLAPSQTTGLPG